MSKQTKEPWWNGGPIPDNWQPSKHTQEPWTVSLHGFFPKGHPGPYPEYAIWAKPPKSPVWHIADIYQVEGGTAAKGNAERIVACVNALAGLDPALVPEMLACLKCFMYAHDHMNATDPHDSRSIHHWDGEWHLALENLRKLLAKIEGAP